MHQPVNIGNPNEFTLLELAKAVIEITGSRSEIVFEALPTDDPQVRQPDISLARELLGWEPTVELREGLRRTLDAAGAAALTGTHPGVTDRKPRDILPRPPVEALEPVADAPTKTPEPPTTRSHAPARETRRAAARGRAPQAPAGALVPAADGDAAQGSRVVSLLALDFAGLLAALVVALMVKAVLRDGEWAWEESLHEARRTIAFAYLVTVLLFARSGLYAERAQRPGHRADRLLAVPGHGRLADLRRWSTTRTTRATTSSTARSSSP